MLDRFHVAPQRFDAGVVVRMMADCPLIDPEVVGKLVALRAERGYGWAAVASGAAPAELGCVASRTASTPRSSPPRRSRAPGARAPTRPTAST